MKKLILYRIRELTINKNKLLNDYHDSPADMQEIMAAQNMEWGIELNFLKKLLETFKEQSYCLLLHEVPYEDLRKEIESALKEAEKEQNMDTYYISGLVLSTLKLTLKKKANQ